MTLPEYHFTSSQLADYIDKVRAAWKEQQKAERLKLDKRIHNQRAALRDNWEIVERRANCLGTKASRASLIRHIKWLHEARAEIARLKNANG